MAVSKALFLVTLAAIHHELSAFSPKSRHQLKGKVNSCFDLRSFARCRSQAMLSSKEMIKKSPREDRNAELLGLRHGDQLVVTDADYDRFSTDLQAIRQKYDFAREISVSQRTSTSSVVLTLENDKMLKKVVDGEIDELECMNSWYGGRIAHVSKSMNAVTISFDHIYNGTLISDAYARLSGVKHAEPDCMLGESSDIKLLSTIAGGTRRYIFSKGEGDAPAGCVYWEHRTFDVTTDGEVTESHDLKAPFSGHQLPHQYQPGPHTCLMQTSLDL